MVIKFKIKFYIDWRDVEKMEACQAFSNTALNGPLVIRNYINNQSRKFSRGILMKYFCCMEMKFLLMLKVI